MALRVRPDLSRIEAYRPGRAIAEVARTYGLDDVAKLASNESPEPPWPEVQAAIAKAAASVHRYPDNDRPILTAALAEHLGIDADLIWCGGAANELTFITGLCMGGPDTSAVYAWPSFSLYRIATRTAFGRDLAVPLGPDHRHDLDAMLAAVVDDTTIVYVCNPNNPSSTHVSGDDLEAFIDAIPDDVLVMVDEAYAEFATAPDYRSMIPLAASRPNVMVIRTFSKVYALAGLRVGYAVTAASSIHEFRRVQLPFSVTNVAEAAAVEALRHQDRVSARVAANRDAIQGLTAFLRERGFTVPDSQANFVYTDLGTRIGDPVEGLLRRGLIVRPVPPDGWVRITAGTSDQNDRLMAAIEELL
ncbi:MAG TPA: histidinol-phosphate transaminase [Acidimicrobiia bacterium]|nr:histidinol-phosphate transaminase [Acidimicrobiia bacterium]